ncbi:hypothetical protein BH18VER1_BH18VER1_05080 [soil metagenome]
MLECTTVDIHRGACWWWPTTCTGYAPIEEPREMAEGTAGIASNVAMVAQLWERRN